MPQFVKHFVQDLTQDIKIRQCGTIVFNGDNLSNVITVDLYNGTEPYSGGGTVAGAVICPDGATVPLTGTLSGNVASVTLTGDCVAIPGQIGIGIQVISGSTRTTVLKAVYNVDLVSTDNVVDPDSRITASVTQLVADIEAATAEIPASDMASLMSGIAPTFSATTNYAAGAYVYYSGTLYRFTNAHAAGSWTGTDATAVALGNDVTDLKSAVDNDSTMLTVDRASYYVMQNRIYQKSTNQIKSLTNFYCAKVVVDIATTFIVSASLTITPADYPLISFIDSNGDYISSLFDDVRSGKNLANYTFTAPTGTAYFYINSSSADISVYQSGAKKIESTIGLTLCEPYNNKQNSIYNSNTQRIQTLSGYNADYYTIDSELNYYVSGEWKLDTGLNAVSYFDENGAYISSELPALSTSSTVTYSLMKLTIPSTAKTFVFSYGTIADGVVYNSKLKINSAIADIKALSDEITPTKIETEFVLYPGSLYYKEDNSIHSYSGSVNACKKYSVSPLKTYRFTSKIQVDPGFPLISYIDANGNLLGFEYNSRRNTLVSVTDVAVNLPAGTAYFYVNSDTESDSIVYYTANKFDLVNERIDGLENGAAGKFDFNVTPTHGQSLSLAIVHGIPPIHTTPISGGFMLNNGVYQVGATAASMSGLVPLREGYDTSLGNNQVENSAWGTSEQIKKLCADSHNLPYNQQFYSACGQDGGNIATQFDTELTVMQRIFDAVKRLMPYKRVGVPAIYWIQGEADNSAQTSGETYKQALIAGLDRISQMAKGTFGQNNDVKCICYQTAWCEYDDRNHYTATQAQMELCRDSDRFAPSCPAYVLIKGPNDYIHISNWGQYLLGLYQGIQFYNLVTLGKKNIGVMPLENGISVSGNTITIQFGVQCAPLRFVTDWVSERQNYGFEVISNGADILTGVAISGIDKVVLTCSQNVASGDTVYYAMQAIKYGNHLAGSGGNLCDSQGDDITAEIDGTTVALNNYCYAFSAVID